MNRLAAEHPEDERYQSSEGQREALIGWSTARETPDPLADRRCIGCGRLLRKDRRWNQCADCDTRTPEDY